MCCHIENMVIKKEKNRLMSDPNTCSYLNTSLCSSINIILLILQIFGVIVKQI